MFYTEKYYQICLIRINVAQNTNITVQFSSVAQSCPTLCDSMNRSTPGLPVHHQLPEFTQTYVHRVGDAIQPSHPLSSPPPPAPNPSQHQSIFSVWMSSCWKGCSFSELPLTLCQKSTFCICVDRLLGSPFCPID